MKEASKGSARLVGQSKAIAQAREFAKQVADALDYVGVLSLASRPLEEVVS